MKVNVDFAQYVATIEFEPFLGDDIKAYQKAFNSWFFIVNKKGTIIKQNPDLHYDSLDLQVIMDWLKIASPNCKARILEPFLKVGEEDKSLPYLCF